MESYLYGVPIFRGLPAARHRQLAAASRLRRFRKGETIFEEDRPANFVWLVKRGWVALVKRTPNGSLATIFVMTPDEVVCGVSAFELGTYSSSAVAATDVQLISIPAKVFDELLTRVPAFAQQVLLACCTRLRHMAEAISIAQSPVEQRLAYVLLRLRANFGATIPITHHELARMAGTRWETSIRTLSSMRRRGWIASSRGKVTILSAKPLRALLTSVNGQRSTTDSRS